MRCVQLYGMKSEDARKKTDFLLDYAVCDCFSIEKTPHIEKGAWGKPYFPHHPHCHFNISHSGDIALCAVSNAEIGVDIQSFRPFREKLLQEMCNEQELAWLDAQADRQSAATLLWAMKESACKWTGRGLTRPISDIAIPTPNMDEKDWGYFEQAGLIFSIKLHERGWISVCAQQAMVGEIIWISGVEEISDGKT